MASNEKQIKYSELESGSFFGEVKSCLSNAKASKEKIQHEQSKSQGKTTIQSIFAFRSVFDHSISSVDKLANNTQKLLNDLGVTMHETDKAMADKIQK